MGFFAIPTMDGEAIKLRIVIRHPDKRETSRTTIIDAPRVMNYRKNTRGIKKTNK